MNPNYVVLFLIGTLLMSLSLGYNDTWQWASDALSNMATGFYGSIVVYYLIERSLERSKESEIFERQKIALTRVRQPLNVLLNFLLMIYKASRLRPETLPTRYDDLFTDEYFENIRFLDFEQDAPVVPKRSWMAYSSQVYKDVKFQLDTIIDSYGFVIDTETIELLEQISNCSIFALIRDFPALIQTDREHGYQRHYLMLNGPHELLREIIPSILQLLKKVNAIVENPIIIHQGFFRDDQSPKWGVNRTHLQLE